MQTLKKYFLVHSMCSKEVQSKFWPFVMSQSSLRLLPGQRHKWPGSGRRLQPFPALDLVVVSFPRGKAPTESWGPVFLKDAVNRGLNTLFSTQLLCQTAQNVKHWCGCFRLCGTNRWNSKGRGGARLPLPGSGPDDRWARVSARGAHGPRRFIVALQALLAVEFYVASWIMKSAQVIKRVRFQLRQKHKKESKCD